MYSNGENNVEQVKKNKGTIILVAILFLALFAIIGYGGWQLSLNNKSENKLSDKAKDDKEEIKEIDAPTEEEKEDEEVVPLKNDKYTFYKEIFGSIELNHNDISVSAYYYVDKEILKNNDQDELIDIEKYVLRREIFVNNKKVGNEAIISLFDDNDDSNISRYIAKDKEFFDNYKTFKSSDNSKEYLVLFLGNNNQIISNDNVINSYDSYSENAYIITEDGLLLKDIINESPGFGLQGIKVDKEYAFYMKYVDVLENVVQDEVTGAMITEYLIYSNSYLDVNENFIYYIVGGCEGFTEYKLSINKDDVNEEKIGSYSDDKIYGAGAC